MLLAAAKYLDSTGNLQRATLNIADSLDPLTAGIPFAIQVQVLNPDDTLMVGSEAVITASLTTNPDGGSLQGATLVQVVGGVASFTDLSIDKVGSEYRLMFSSSGFDAITGDPAVVVAGQPAGLQFLQQPQAATSFQDLASPVSVPIVDAHGKPVGNAALDVTIDIKSNKGKLILHASGPSDPDTAGE